MTLPATDQPRFDPLDPAYIEDPYPALARARENAPVLYLPEYDMYAVTRFRDVEAILRDPVKFSAEPQGGVAPPPPPEYADRLPNGWPFHPSVASIDGSEHLRLRRLAQKAFTTKQAAAKEQAIRELAHLTIDGFVDRGRADLSLEYAKQIPIRTIAPMFGVAPEMGPVLHGWALTAVQLIGNPRLDRETLLECAEGQAAFVDFVEGLVEERRQNPLGDDDLVTALVQARDDEGEAALTNREIVSLVHAGIAGGAETAATTISHAVHLLLGERTRWERLVADTALARDVCEETLRILSSSRGIFRRALEDVELHGVRITAGSIVYLLIASTGRDPEIFERPDEFRCGRPNIREHLGFGRGTHFCLGAPLSRLEITVALEVLAERLPDLRLAADCELVHMQSMRVPAVLRGLSVGWG